MNDTNQPEPVEVPCWEHGAMICGRCLSTYRRQPDTKVARQQFMCERCDDTRTTWKRSLVTLSTNALRITTIIDDEPYPWLALWVCQNGCGAAFTPNADEVSTIRGDAIYPCRVCAAPLYLCDVNLLDAPAPQP